MNLPYFNGYLVKTCFLVILQEAWEWLLCIHNGESAYTHVDVLTKAVVYNDQRLGAAHPKRWSKSKCLQNLAQTCKNIPR